MTGVQFAQALYILAILMTTVLAGLICVIDSTKWRIIFGLTLFVDAIIAVFSGTVYFGHPGNHGGMSGFTTVYLLFSAVIGGVALWLNSDL